MEIDKRIVDLKLTIRAISELAAKTPDCIRFDIGQPDFDTPDHIKASAIKAIKEGFTGYTSAFGVSELREAIAARESEKGLQIDKENVLVTSGGMGALFSSFSAILKPGDEVILPNPHWAPYIFSVVTAHGRPVPTEFFENGELNVGNIEEQINERTKAIVVNTPENPTGRVFKKDELEEIAQLAVGHDLFVISDEVYDKILFETAKHFSIASVCPERTLLINSCSKTYAMTGWRVGWVVAEKDIIHELMKCSRASVTCPNSIAQKAALTAITSDQGCVERMRSEYENRRDFAVEKLGEMGLEFIKPEGAFYVFPEIKRDSWEFSLELIKHGVSVVPGSAFGSMGEQHVRLALTTGIDRMRDGLERIRTFLER